MGDWLIRGKENFKEQQLRVIAFVLSAEIKHLQKRSFHISPPQLRNLISLEKAWPWLTGWQRSLLNWLAGLDGNLPSEMMEEDVSGMCHMLMAAGCCCPPRDALQKPWVLQEPGESSTPELGSLFLLQCLSSALYWCLEYLDSFLFFPILFSVILFFFGGGCIFRLLFI